MRCPAEVKQSLAEVEEQEQSTGDTTVMMAYIIVMHAIYTVLIFRLYTWT